MREDENAMEKEAKQLVLKREREKAKLLTITNPKLKSRRERDKASHLTDLCRARGE